MYFKSLLLLTFLLFTLSTNAQSQTWTLVYENDKSGQEIQGSKAALIEAVKDGKDIKVAWTMGGKANSVYHTAEVSFLTIMKDEVFGQIEEINAQVPNFQEVSMKHFGKTTGWSMIASTTGENSTLLYDKTNNEKEFTRFETFGVKWYVKE